ncbi:terminase small subunit (plasmid) [Roseomonas marmotae]|uniref:terminase small subunit n=1 Tax=Roseomonas marmotae TaxID=2768161 RepID=UPI001AD66A4B|nr:terminase small subunit [Roseomonas marmotae]QTI81480.1 terminase small subunit [Roseomonas marmotae]
MQGKIVTYPVSTIAKLLMLSERQVYNLVNENVIPRAETGRYELAPAVQGYIRYLRDRSIRNLENADEGATDYRSEKARLTKAQADLAEIQLAKARGDVAPVDQVERAVSKAFAEVRAGMRNVPSRVVSQLIGETDERRFKAVLLSEIDGALAALAEANVLAPEDDHDDDADDAADE